MSMRERHFMDPRRSGTVLRYHTFPTLQRQSVAEHTWQVLRVLWAIWPDVPRHVIQYALVHDCGEVRVGDLPYPSKGEASEDFQSELRLLEFQATLSMCAPWSLPAPPVLKEEEAIAFKFAEYIEMWEFGLTEVNLGNRYGTLIVERTCGAWTRSLGNERLPDHIRRAALFYIERRQKQEEEIGT